MVHRADGTVSRATRIRVAFVAGVSCVIVLAVFLLAGSRCPCFPMGGVLFLTGANGVRAVIADKLDAVFIGHNAVAFAAKRVAPRTSLGVLMAAAMFVDLLWPILLLLGVEHVRIQRGATRFSPLDFYDYPWTHSLVMAIAWGVLFAIVYWAVTRYGRGALVVGLCVVSHWLLDFIVHRPDLPIFPGGGPKVGLGLWNSPIATIGIESAMFAIGILIYRDTVKPRDRIGSVAFWAFVLFLAAVYIASASGAPPPNVRALAYVGLAGWILPFWAGWFDRHREANV